MASGGFNKEEVCEHARVIYECKTCVHRNNALVDALRDWLDLEPIKRNRVQRRPALAEAAR